MLGHEVLTDGDEDVIPPLLFRLNVAVSICLSLPVCSEICRHALFLASRNFLKRLESISMTVPLMPRHIFIEAPSIQVLKEVLMQTPYSLTHICRVLSEFIYPLTRYLLNPAVLPPFSWIRLVRGGSYRGRLGVVSCNSTVLLLPRYNQTLARHLTVEPMFFAPDTVVGQAGLFELNFDLLCHNIEFVDPFMDSVFVESAQCLVESGHPDVFHAWQDVWVATWPDGCIVKLIDSADGKKALSDI